jgi:hypothetical protein
MSDSAFQQQIPIPLNLTTDATGILPVNKGGTGQTSSTPTTIGLLTALSQNLQF